MEEAPDSALVMLSHIDKSGLSESNSVYYSLLFTQAQIKCGIILTSDSLIKKAYQKYKFDNNKNLQMRAYFYEACVQYNRRDLRDAMKNVLCAYDIAKAEGDNYWTAKSSEVIADIYFDSYNYHEAELFRQETIDNYYKCGKIASQRYAICDLAIIYANNNKCGRAIEILDSLQQVCSAEPQPDENLLGYIRTPLTSVLIQTNRYDELNDECLNLLSESSLNDDDMIDRAILESHITQQDSIDPMSQMLLSNASDVAKNDEQKARILYAEYLCAKRTGDFKRAAAMTDTLLIMQSAIAESVLKESVACVQRDYYLSKADSQERRSGALKKLLTFVVITALIIILLIWILLRYRIKSQRSELESNISAILHLKEQSSRVLSENSRLSKEIIEKSNAIDNLTLKLNTHLEKAKNNAEIVEHLFKDKWSTMNMLCNEYFEMDKSENTRKAVLHKIDLELKKLRSKESLKQIELAVDNYMENIMTKLRTQCTFLKEDEFVFLSLVYAGFSVRAVCMLTDIKYKFFYLRKSRLTKKISTSTAPDKSLFLSKI